MADGACCHYCGQYTCGCDALDAIEPLYRQYREAVREIIAARPTPEMRRAAKRALERKTNELVWEVQGVYRTLVMDTETT